MILITGATGKSGSEIARQLSAAGAPTRALVRNPQKAQALADLPHVEIVEGDLNQPATLDAALRGIDKVLLLSSPAPQQVELQGNLIEAAQRASRAHIVKFSAQGADASAPEGFMKWHGQTEDQLKASGLAYTNLQPTLFMQEFLNSWGGRDTIYLPLKDAKVGIVDVRDIAAVAVKTLTEDGHAGKSYIITGPEALSFSEIADKISVATGDQMGYVSITLADFRRALLDMQLPEWLADAITQLYDYLSKDEASQVTDTVREVGRKQPISFDEFAREHAPAFKVRSS